MASTTAARIAPSAVIGAVIGVALALVTESPAAAPLPKIVELTQVACQFVEAENGIDHHFEAMKPSDCEAINRETAAARLAKATVLTLAPGKYVFRVTNRDVPYELGFWLREEEYNWRNPIHKLTKVSISGGGLFAGQSHDYLVDLQPGAYIYSCPLNPTPNYKLVVQE